MDTTLLVGILGVGGTLLGSLGGVALGAWLSRQQAQQLQTRDRDNVRTLLRLECKSNIRSLLQYWDKVSSEGVHLPGQGQLIGIGTTQGEGAFDKRQRLSREPVPIWRMRAWEQQAGLVALALDHDEIERVYTLYSDLEAFTASREELREVFEKPDGQAVAKTYHDWMWNRKRVNPDYGLAESGGIEARLLQFNETTHPLWDACQAVVYRAAPYRNTAIIADDAPPLKRRGRAATRFHVQLRRPPKT